MDVLWSMRLLFAIVGAVAVTAGASAQHHAADSPAAGRVFRESAMTVELDWLRVRIQYGWSVRGVSGGTVIATPIASGWSRTASLTVAPFPLPVDLGRYESSPAIPPGMYQIWIYATRRSRRGTRPGPVPTAISGRDRVAHPPPGVGTQFVQIRQLGDRTIGATVSLAPDANVDRSLEEANGVLRTLRMTE